MARVLSGCASQRTIWFVLCNEEHVPWTSQTVAAGVAREGLNVRAVLNVDSIAGRSDEAGIPNAVLNIGSYPYADAEYHSAGDIPERVDIDNLVMAVQLSLAFVVDVDRNG